MKEENINIGKFFREKRNYLEYWRKFNIIKIIAKHSLLTGGGYKVKCCRMGNNSKITLTEYLISHESIIVRFKKSEINYIFRWIVEYLRDGDCVIGEE